MKQTYEGIVIADVCEARFAYSGLVTWVGKKAGDRVVKGDVLASLDPKIFQMDLDRQLADYDRIRAEFEMFKKKSGNDTSEEGKYLMQVKQSALNIAVKDMELAKYKMELTHLKSPVNGIATDTEGIRTGLNITPASNPVKILDMDSLRFSFEITGDDLDIFQTEVELRVKFKGVKDELNAKTMPPLWIKNSEYTVFAYFEKRDGLYPGMAGIAKIIK